MTWLIWVGLAVLLAVFVAVVAVLYWPQPRRQVSRPQPEARRDVEVTYAKTRAALPESIRDDFHPEWPWLNPDDVPRLEKPRTPDADLFEVWGHSQGRAL